MPVPERTDEQFSIALESIQGKRRAELTVAAATALLDRFADQRDPVARLRLTHELIRRNFAPDVRLDLGSAVLGPDTPEPAETTFRAEITGGVPATLSAGYRVPDPAGRTAEEWRNALTLLAGIAALGAGGRLTCP
ncbi:hypothetical protein [Actinoplanes sp. NPDC049265]|uniref:hypothetical protein n=1 Tax=Actinoplanes sp. NPDC049265 TaxID=3363902 RepID=UPI003714558D